MTRTGLNRRQFLLGAGGAALALPFFEANVANADGKPLPKRLVIFFHEGGTLVDEWRPSGSEANFQLSNILSPLEPHKQKLVVVAGLWNQARWLSPTWENHTGSKGSMLTGSTAMSEGVQYCWPNAASVDRVLASRLPITPKKTIDICVGPNHTDYEGVFSFTGPNAPVTSRFNNPADLYQNLLGSVQPESPAVAALRARRLSVLDAVQENFALFRKKLGSADRARLDQHAQFVRDLELSLGTSAAMGCQAPAAPAKVDPLDHEAALDQHGKLLALALACDLTRVATVYPQDQQASAPGGIAIPGGVWHNFLHNTPADAAALDTRRQVFRWHYKLLAKLLAVLDAVPEGGGTLLDNTLVLAISEFGSGSFHDGMQEKQNPHRGLPVVLAGGLGGALKTGRFLDYQAKRNHNDLLITLLHLFGYDDKTFGRPELCAGPLAEITGA